MANWQTNGNSTAPGDFIGTTTDQPLVVKTDGAERARVQPDGKIGVGLSDPRTDLHVLGRISTGLDHTSAGAISFFPPDGFAWFHIDNGPAGSRPLGRLRFSHGVTPGAHELMTMAQDGNVGVGTTAPETRLHVEGNRIRLRSGGRQLDLRSDGAAVDVQSETHSLYLHSLGPRGRNHVIINPFGQSGNVGIATQTPTEKLHVVGNVRASDFIVTSDARLKADVGPLRDALGKLKKLRGVEFTWKSAAPPPFGEDAASRDEAGHDAAGKRWGVIAQEIEAVAPELVHGKASESDMRGVNLGGMLATLIEAVKELAADNDRLRARIDLLEGQAAGS
jgi:hypothetical protein